jgi:hypothetical protein
MWRDVLAQAGVTVETVDADHVRLRSDAGARTLLLRHIDHPISPSQVPAPSEEPALLALPKATDRTVAAAARSGWDVVTDSGTISLRFGAGEVCRKHADTPTRPRDLRPGPTSWATFTLCRRLLAGPPAGQVELARRADASQSRVSRALTRLRDQALVERTTSGWQPVDWNALLDWWLETYPGAAGVTTYWYSLDDPATQARKVLEAVGSRSRAAFSGDPAADLLAPWRRPSTVTVYLDKGVPLEPAGFVPVSSSADATLTVCAPKDPGVWLPALWLADGLPFADPVQIVYDVANGPGTDRDEAVAHLREALRTRHAAHWRAVATGKRR